MVQTHGGVTFSEGVVVGGGRNAVPVYRDVLDTESYNRFVEEQQKKLESNIASQREARQKQLEQEEKARAGKALVREKKFSAFETVPFLARQTQIKRQRVELGRGERLTQRANIEVQRFAEQETERFKQETEAAKPRFSKKVFVGYSDELAPSGEATGMSSAQLELAAGRYATPEQEAQIKLAQETKLKTTPYSGVLAPGVTIEDVKASVTKAKQWKELSPIQKEVAKANVISVIAQEAKRASNINSEINQTITNFGLSKSIDLSGQIDLSNLRSSRNLPATAINEARTKLQRLFNQQEEIENKIQVVLDKNKVPRSEISPLEFPVPEVKIAPPKEDWLGTYAFKLQEEQEKLSKEVSRNTLQYQSASFVQGAIGGVVGTGLLAQDVLFGGGQKTIKGLQDIAGDPAKFGQSIVTEATANPARFAGELFGSYGVTKGGTMLVKKGLAVVTKVGIPKTKLSALRESSESFPLTKGGTAQLKKEVLGNKIKTTLSKTFPKIVEKEKPLVVRTALKETKLEKVAQFAQYEEAAPFYSPKLSLIGLPQFESVGKRVVPKLSLFKGGLEKGQIEVLIPKAFKKLPTTKTFKDITLAEYKKLSSFAGIELEKLGTAIKSLKKIRIKEGENILLKEFEKVKSGKRPFKLRETEVIVGGREKLMTAFVEPKAKTGVVYPSRAFQLGVSSEAEVVLFPKVGERLVRIGQKGVRQKLFGAGSAYAVEDGKTAAIKFYKVLTGEEFKKLPFKQKIVYYVEKPSLKKSLDVARRSARDEVVERIPIITAPRLGVLTERLIDRKMKKIDEGVLEQRRAVKRKAERVEDYFVVRDLDISKRGDQDLVVSRRVSAPSYDKSGISEIREITKYRDFVPFKYRASNYVPLRIPTYAPPRTPTYAPPRTPTYAPPKTTTIRIQPKNILQKSKPITKATTGFDVYVRKQGKAILVGKNLPKYKAITKGALVTAKDISRSFAIKPSGITLEKDLFAPNIKLTQMFRKPVPGRQVAREGYIFTEKTKFAIDDVFEKKTLKQARKQKESKQ